MKSGFTRMLLLLAVVYCYTSCKKSAIKPVDKTNTDYAALSKQIALNLVQSISGKYGGANINEGIKAPSHISSNHSGPVLFSVNPLCGYTIDTTYNTTATAGDTTKTFFGNFKFVYTCSTTIPDGYLVHDSLMNTEKGPLFNNKYTTAQNYKVKALDQTYKLVSMDGYLYSLVETVNSVGYNYVYIGYKLQGLKVDVSSGSADVISGTALLNITLVRQDKGWPDNTINMIAGTLEYLGNHMAKLTLTPPNKSYLVNLLTGEVTAL
ncbi:hypothetical protein [Mucilaginibacter sp.]|uniref:hypothetical protein n=1 Tax=Mucilaginibacter sp. TaxID=1882438 RepID=UPI0025E994B0|nr:hypothetical protein [Mucilaginibacter sp.]